MDTPRGGLQLCRRELVLSPGFHRSCPVKGRAIPVVRGYHYIKLRTKTQV